MDVRSEMCCGAMMFKRFGESRLGRFLFSVDDRGHDETVPERRQRYFETVMAVMMSVAAISATWASFESARWGGTASGLVSQSSVLRADSGRWAARGAEQTTVDASVWVEWQKAVILGRDDVAKFTAARFSPELDAAQKTWLGLSSGEDADELPKGTPMGLDSYVPPGQKRSEDLASESERLLGESSQYSSVSGKYTMLTVMFALVLFFGSVATKFASPKLQLALGSLTAVLLILACVRVASLPII